jgi:reactive intermediate/imine deaminase
MPVTMIDSAVGTPPGRPYSQAVRKGTILAISGQTPLDANGQVVGEGDARAQTRCVLDRITQLLADAGAELTDVIKVTVYLADFADFAAVNEVYADVFPAPRPARSTVACGLVRPEFLVEIDALAVLDS